MTYRCPRTQRDLRCTQQTYEYSPHTKLMVLPRVHLLVIFHPIGLRITGEAEKGAHSTPPVCPHLAQHGQNASQSTGEKDQRCVTVFSSPRSTRRFVRCCLGICSTYTRRQMFSLACSIHAIPSTNMESRCSFCLTPSSLSVMGYRMQYIFKMVAEATKVEWGRSLASR